MEPTGSHETVSGKLATQIGMAITAAQLPWFIPQTCLICVSGIFCPVEVVKN